MYSFYKHSDLLSIMENCNSNSNYIINNNITYYGYLIEFFEKYNSKLVNFIFIKKSKYKIPIYEVVTVVTSGNSLKFEQKKVVTNGDFVTTVTTFPFNSGRKSKKVSRDRVTLSPISCIFPVFDRKHVTLSSVSCIDKNFYLKFESRSPVGCTFSNRILPINCLPP